MKRALITGVTGQDGAYLSQLLLGRATRSIGLLRRSASADVIGERLRWLGMPIRSSWWTATSPTCPSSDPHGPGARPDEVYNLAPRASSTPPGASRCSPARHRAGRGQLLEAVRHRAPEARFYQALLGDVRPIQAPGRTRPRRSTRAAPTRSRNSTATG